MSVPTPPSWPARLSYDSGQSLREPTTNLFAFPPARTEDPLPSGTTAWFDDKNRVVHLPPTWNEFALRMGQPELERLAMLSRPLGHFLSDATTRDFFQLLFRNVRTEGRAAQIRARCDDSAGRPRAMRLTFIPHSVGAVACTWTFILGSAAESVPLVRRWPLTGHGHICACGWCRRIQLGPRWVSLDEAAPLVGMLERRVLPAVTHGICPRCSSVLRSEIEQAQRECIVA